jgi:hypothetical protein
MRHNAGTCHNTMCVLKDQHPGECEELPNAITPTYYHGDTVMRFIEEFDLSFCLGNTVKYIARQKHKNQLEDLKKALWYL